MSLMNKHLIRLFAAMLVAALVAVTCLACNAQAYKNDDNIEVKEDQVEQDVENPIRINMNLIISAFFVIASILIMALVLVIKKQWEKD